MPSATPTVVRCSTARSRLSTRPVRPCWSGSSCRWISFLLPTSARLPAACAPTPTRTCPSRPVPVDGVEGCPHNREMLLERDAQLGALTEYADDARAGRGRLVLVSGESGIGKTALVEAFERSV